VYLTACIELEGRYRYRVTLCCNDRAEWLTEQVGIGRALRQVHNIPLWTCRFHGWMNSRRPQIVVHMKVVSCSSFNFVAIMWRLPTCFHHVCQNFDRQLYRNLIESHGCPVIKKNNCNNNKLENETQLHLNSTTTTQHNFLCLDMDSASSPVVGME